MVLSIGIRAEDKNQWEARAPLVPAHVNILVEKFGLEVTIQPSDIRAFSDREFEKAGAMINEDISGCDLVLAVKEIPKELFSPNKSYLFFSHTIKGQLENMPMLKKLMEKKCQLIDYEKITDSKNNRLIFFGRHAGLVGMINTLWALGRRLLSQGIKSPFSKIEQAIEYKALDDAKKAVSLAGEELREMGLSEKLGALVFGFTGYGNVSNGALEIFDLLPFIDIAPKELLSDDFEKELKGRIGKVVFMEKDMFCPKDKSANFELQDYFDHPEKYESRFEKYIEKLAVLVNAIYWDKPYPRLVTKKYLFDAIKKGALNLRVIGDITCDTEGSIQCNLGSTDSGNPVYVYDPINDKAVYGVKGAGPVVLATDNLPCELGRESSEAFSEVLIKFIPEIAKGDFTGSFENSGLPNEIKRAVILWHGKLTKDFLYLNEHVDPCNEK